MDDISQVNLIVGWKELAKFTKMETFPIGMFNKENMSLINLFHTKGFFGLAVEAVVMGSSEPNNEMKVNINIPMKDR